MPSPNSWVETKIAVFLSLSKQNEGVAVQWMGTDITMWKGNKKIINGGIAPSDKDGHCCRCKKIFIIIGLLVVL